MPVENSAPVAAAEATPAPVVPATTAKRSIGEALAANLAATQATPPAAAEPVVSAAEAEVPAVETPAAKSLADLARERGFADVKDDNEAAERLLAALDERDQQARDAAERAAKYEQLAMWRAQQTTQQQPAAQPAQQQSDPYGALQLDEDRIQEHFDPVAKTWRDGTPDDVKHSAARYEAARKQRLAAIVDNPREFLAPLLEEFLSQGLQKHTAALESKTEEEAAKQRFLREAEWAFQRDPVTNQRKKDARGEFIPSADGIKFGEYMEAAADLGITSLSGQLKYATEQRELATFRSQQGQQSSAQQAQKTNEQLKQDLLKRAIPGQSAGGTFTQPGEAPRTQNQHLSAGERLRQNMVREGILS